MAVVLNYNLQEGFTVLAGDRWNVLTAIMLHANGPRLRAWPTMDRIAKLATNSDPNRATKAKKWLLAHGAIELVPYGKRMDKERELPPRQHVYQLTGHFTTCDDPACCEYTKRTFDYLYTGKVEVMADNNNEGKTEVMGSNNFEAPKPPEVMADNNFKVIEGHIMNGNNQTVLKRTDKDTSNDVAQSAAPSSNGNHKHDPVFTTVAREVFGIEGKISDKNVRGRINGICKTARNAFEDQFHVAPDDKVCNAIMQFCRYCMVSGMICPKGRDKFGTNFTAFLQDTARKKQKRIIQMPPPEPEISEDERQRRLAETAKALREGKARLQGRAVNE